MGLDETVLVMNAWRRVCAFMSLVGCGAISDVDALADELLAPALVDLGELCDRIPPAQLKAANSAPSTWTPDFREPRWRPPHAAE